MKTLNPISTLGNLCLTFLFFACITPALNAQDQDVCVDDCSNEVFQIELNVPLDGPLTDQRTNQFKTAYQQVKQIKDKLRQDPMWEGSYNNGMVGGKSCVRLKQLEGHFAYEYERNPEFKQFIDQQEPGGTAFLKNGFENSRHALNILQRMDDKCPWEVKDLEKEKDPSLNDLSPVYTQLGQSLGYFSDAPVSEKSTNCELKKAKGLSKIFKSRRVKYLNKKLKGIPLDSPLRDAVAGLAEDLKQAGPKQEQLDQSLNKQEPRISTLPPQLTGLAKKLEANEADLKDLQAFKPKNPKNDLTPKINPLVEERKELSKEAEDLMGKAQNLQKEYEQLNKEKEELEKALNQQTTAAEEMQNKLKELEQEKQELVALLEQKPRQIKNELDNIAKRIAKLCEETEELRQKVEGEKARKEESLNKLNDLRERENDLNDELSQLEKDEKDLARKQTKLEEEIKKLQWEVEQIKKEEATVDGLKEKIADLDSEKTAKERIDDCEEYLKQQQKNKGETEETIENFEAETAELSKIPAQVTDKLSDLQLLLNKLKLGYDGIAISERSEQKIEQLLEKASVMNSSAEILADKQNQLQQQLADLGSNMAKVNEMYASMGDNFSELRKELTSIYAEKSQVQQKLNKGVKDLDEAFALVNDFMNRYDDFDKKSDCPEKKQIEALDEEKANIGQALEDLKSELNDLEEYEEKLQQEVAVMDAEIKEHTRLMKDLQKKEEELTKEFGEVSLEPVEIQEWKESNEVKRDYWEASAVDDEELVRGFKGKYFEVSLRDADKKAQILFRPGRYYMSNSEFRNNYGATIGSFVNEALLYLRQGDEGQVKLFIQGSADISGHKTFRGKLNSNFPYNEVVLLPLDTDNKHFLGDTETLEISATSFTNDDLPNLRARYLKEILGAYTDKFDPIILEGVVKDFEGADQRNASIYLFFPDELLDKYAGN